MKEKIAKWYKQRLWTKEMVRNAVVKTVLTAAEYQEITGEEYGEAQFYERLVPTDRRIGGVSGGGADQKRKINGQGAGPERRANGTVCTADCRTAGGNGADKQRFVGAGV